MLKDKVVIVTGGSGLIGREIVKDIVRKGGIAVNADIHVSTDLNKREIYVDISDEQSVREVIRTVCQKFGRDRRIGKLRLSADKGLGNVF